MKQHNSLHWSAHVGCAITGAVAVAMLVISDLVHVASVGRWGVLLGLVASVIAAAIVADRCATKLAIATDDRAAVALTEIEAAIARHAASAVIKSEEQTQEIAHAVCDSVLNAIDSRMGPAPTLINRRP